MTRPLVAMVLAAGLGTRMRPLTDTVPKPLVALSGKPLIDHVLDRLAAVGVEKTVVNVNYLADRIEAHLAGRERPEIVISDERDEILDTGGGVVRALSLLGGESFLVHNSDSVWVEGANAALENMIAGWDEKAMDALLLLAPVDRAVGYSGAGDFTMDTYGRLARRGSEKAAPFVFTGVSIIHPRLLDGMPEGPFSLNRPWDRAIEAGRLFGTRHDGIWMHVGTPEALAEAETTLQAGDG